MIAYRRIYGGMQRMQTNVERKFAVPWQYIHANDILFYKKKKIRTTRDVSQTGLYACLETKKKRILMESIRIGVS